jgi:transglutaminase-like putative cysteine protease
MSYYRFLPPEVLKLSGDPTSQFHAVQRLVRPWEVEHLITRGVPASVVQRRPPLAEQVAQWLRDSLNNGLLTYKLDPGGFLDHWSSPGATLQRRTGDCEDFTLIGVSILAAVGVSSDVAIGTLWNGHSAGGHAWIEGQDERGGFLIEATSGDIHRHWRPAEYTLSRRITPHLAQRAA